MRILDADNDRTIDRVALYLTKNEAKELMDSLAHMIAMNNNGHDPISDSNYPKQISVCIDDEIVLEDSAAVP